MGFFDILTKPDETMKTLVKKVDFMEATKTFAIYGAIIGLLIGLFLALIAGFISSMGLLAAVPGAAILGGLGLAAIVIMPIIIAILAVVGSLIGSALAWLGVRILGGKGTVMEVYFLQSKMVWPVLVVSIIVGILTMIPLLGGLINFVWGLYSIYLTVTLLSISQKVSKLRALAGVLLLVVVVIIIAVIISMMFGAALFGAMAAARP